jgi:hypothetical protein
MRNFMRSVVAVLAAVGVLIVIVNAARAEEVKAPIAAAGKTEPAYVAPLGGALPGAHVESVLTDLRGAVAGTRRGTGWLLHYGTEDDTCARADATSGSRVMCVAW